MGVVLAMAGAVYGLRLLRLHANRRFYAGRIVLITGASRGIGSLLAYGLAARGAKLVLAARTHEQLEAVASECRKINPDTEIVIVPTDVADDAQLINLVETTRATFGHIDVLINNAGIRQGGAFAERSRYEGRAEIEVNLLAAMRLAQLALPYMLERRTGAIINIASAAGRLAEPYFVPYGVSKHGLIGFSDGLRREVAGSGVHVMVVLPDFAATDMVTEIGPVYKRMGMPIIRPERIARRAFNGLILKRAYVKVGWLSAIGGYIGVLFPFVIDLFFRLFMPDDFAEAARRQRSE
jgi:hypothetical protein